MISSLVRLGSLSLALLAPGIPAHAGLASPDGLQVLTVVGGQPDDITVDTGGHLVWGDLSRGTLDRLIGAKVVVLARGLNVPEGVVAVNGGRLLVAEQGRDRIDVIDARGSLRVLYKLKPVPGQEGVDGIGLSRGAQTIVVPDSPRGRVFIVDLKTGAAHGLAQGLGRPVDAAVDHHGSVLVPDEHLGTLVVIAPNRRLSFRGRFATPDDVAVDARGRIWVTSLGDGTLWMLPVHGAQKRLLTGLANPQGLTLDACGDPIVVEQGKGRIDRLLVSATGSRCRF